MNEKLESHNSAVRQQAALIEAKFGIVLEGLEKYGHRA